MFRVAALPGVRRVPAPYQNRPSALRAAECLYRKGSGDRASLYAFFVPCRNCTGDEGTPSQPPLTGRSLSCRRQPSQWVPWSRWRGLNPRPDDYKSPALPSELHRHTAQPELHGCHQVEPLLRAAAYIFERSNHSPVVTGAGDEDRTRIPSLEGWCSAIEPHLRAPPSFRGVNPLAFGIFANGRT